MAGVGLRIPVNKSWTRTPSLFIYWGTGRKTTALCWSTTKKNFMFPSFSREKKEIFKSKGGNTISLPIYHGTGIFFCLKLVGRIFQSHGAYGCGSEADRIAIAQDRNAVGLEVFEFARRCGVWHATVFFFGTGSFPVVVLFWSSFLVANADLR